MAFMTTALRVRQFIVRWCGLSIDRVREEHTLFGDLGLDGDDAAELLEGLEAAFDVSLRDLQNRFGGEGFHPGAVRLWVKQEIQRGAAEDVAGLAPLPVKDLVDRIAGSSRTQHE